MNTVTGEYLLVCVNNIGAVCVIDKHNHAGVHTILKQHFASEDFYFTETNERPCLYENDDNLSLFSEIKKVVHIS
jgi:hypothetical protein